MAKEKETPEDLNLNAAVTVSAADLIKLFAEIQAKGSSDNAKVLADAFEKLTPGYKSPEQKQFEADAKVAQRGIEAMKIKRKRQQQRACEHEVGQTGRKRLGEGAFNMLKLPTGEMIGVCTYCQMVISSANPLHQKFFRKAGGTAAESGQFVMADPIKAQLARLSPDEREKVLAVRKEYFANVPKDEELDEELV